MGSIVYRCPSCERTAIRYDYSLKMSVCKRCGKPLKDFERDIRAYVFQRIIGSRVGSEEVKTDYSSKKTEIGILKAIPTTISCKDNSISPETFDLLEEMMKRIDPNPYSWNEMEVWMTTHPSMEPYLQTDRAKVRVSHACMGSIPVHCQRPDGKQAHFGIVDFWDTKDLHHNLELWWKNFEGENGYDKNVKGHRKFDIKKDVVIESKFKDETVQVEFRGKKPGEKVKPEKQRRPP